MKLSKKEERKWREKQFTKFDRYALYFLLKERNRIWRRALMPEGEGKR